MEHSLSDQFTLLLDLISELYPNTDDEVVLADKDYLTKWAVALLVFETQNMADQPNVDDCEFILNLSTYQHLSFVIARRFYASHDPQDTGNRFDYGKERKSRESIREKIKALTDTIVEFYTSHADQLLGDHHVEPLVAPPVAPQEERRRANTSADNTLAERRLRLVASQSDFHSALDHNHTCADDLSQSEQGNSDQGELVSMALPSSSPISEDEESDIELADVAISKENAENSIVAQAEGRSEEKFR